MNNSGILPYAIPLPWNPQLNLENAIEEASRMEKQYQLLLTKSFSQIIPSHVLLTARRYVMESNSFIVSLRRKGFQWALQDSYVHRSISPDKPDQNQTVLLDPEPRIFQIPNMEISLPLSNLSFSFEE